MVKIEERIISKVMKRSLMTDLFNGGGLQKCFNLFGKHNLLVAWEAPEYRGWCPNGWCPNIDRFILFY